MEMLFAVVLIGGLMASKELRGLVAIIVVCAVVAGYWNVDHKAEARLQQVAPIGETIDLGSVKHVITVEAPPPEEDDVDEPAAPVTVEVFEHGSLNEE